MASPRNDVEVEAAATEGDDEGVRALDPGFLLRHAAHTSKTSLALHGTVAPTTTGVSRATHGSSRVGTALELATHLKLASLGLRTLRGIGRCRGMTALYAYENEIPSLPPDMDKCSRLAQAFLQRNCIRVLSNTRGLAALEKLHLDVNWITEVTGLEHCPRLVELSLNDQQTDIALTFSEDTLASLARSLLRLRVSGNRLESTAQLSRLSRLVELECARNRIHSPDEAAMLVHALPRLRRIDLRDNPVALEHSFLPRLIAAAESNALDEVNGVQITNMQRDFVRRLEMRRSGVGAGHHHLSSSSATTVDRRDMSSIDLAIHAHGARGSAREAGGEDLWGSSSDGPVRLARETEPAVHHRPTSSSLSLSAAASSSSSARTVNRTRPIELAFDDSARAGRRPPAFNEAPPPAAAASAAAWASSAAEVDDFGGLGGGGIRRTQAALGDARPAPAPRGRRGITPRQESGSRRLGQSGSTTSLGSGAALAAAGAASLAAAVSARDTRTPWGVGPGLHRNAAVLPRAGGGFVAADAPSWARSEQLASSSSVSDLKPPVAARYGAALGAASFGSGLPPSGSFRPGL